MILSSDLIHFDPTALLKSFDPDGRLDHYFELLADENSRINLVSRETSRDGLIQLAAESLLPFQYCQCRQIDRFLDIGSGGGFPAFPILLTQSVRQATLVERTQKKAAALDRFAHDKSLAVSANVTLVNQTFEEWKSNDSFDLITLRLVRLTPILLKRILSRVSPGGLFIYYAVPTQVSGPEPLDIMSYRYSSGQSAVVKSFTFIRKK